MIPLPTDDIAHALGLAGLPAGTIGGVATDSRAVQPGEVFVALAGRHQDGREFVSQALARGARFALVGPGTTPPAGAFVVPDPVWALGRIAGLVRARFRGPVVGITGTAGKTTVKEFLRGLLQGTRQAILPEASFNNREGVPRTITKLEPATEVLVCEVGTNAPGEIAELCALVRPTLGVITSIGPGHLQGLKSVEGVLEEKLDLARSLPGGATLVLNGDDPLLSAARLPSSLRVIRAGLDAREGVVVPGGAVDGGSLRFEPAGPVFRHRLGTRVLVRNLWIALVVARELGLSAEELAAATPSLRPAAMRGEVRELGGATVIVDCYNANPLSMKEAIADLSRRTGRRTAILGEMRELGDATESHHRDLGRQLAAAVFDRVLFVGPSHRSVVDAARDAGLAADRIEGFDELEPARPSFRAAIAGGGTVLMKASRGVRLERFLEESA